jgi:CRP/FNR family transcriptional regulator, cyclic AMP receptor protein
VHFLASAAERGTRTPAGQRIAILPKELAARVGLKPNQVDDVLVKLVKAGIVSVLPDGFVVPDVSKLRQFLEFLQMKSYFGDVS